MVLGHFVVFGLSRLTAAFTIGVLLLVRIILNFPKLNQIKANASVIATVSSQQVQVLSASTQSGDLSTVAANFSKLYLLFGYASYYHIKHSISVVWHTTLLHSN